MSFERHSSLTDFTQRSANEFKSGPLKSSGQLDRRDADRLNGEPERLAKLGVPVVDKISARGQKADIGHGHVAGYLNHPLFVRMGCDARNVDASRSQVDEERRQPTLSPHLRGEEVRRCEDVCMRADELLPGRGPLSLRSRWYAVAPQNVPHRLVAHLVTEVRQGTGDSVVTPTLIFGCETDDQFLDLFVDPRPPGVFPFLRAVELLRHELPMPGQDRLELHNARHFLERLPPKPLTNLRQRPSLAVCQFQAAFGLSAQNSVLGGQVLVSQEQLLVD